MKRLGRIVAALAVVWFGSALAGEDSQSNKPMSCFDVAVIATQVSEDATPIRSDDPNMIIMDARFHWKYKIEKLLAGAESRPEIDVFGFQHVGFNKMIRHFLLFLRRGEDNSYERVGLEHQLVEDGNGRFLMPMARPLTKDELEGRWSMPTSYETLLRRIIYRAEDAWWLRGLGTDALDGEPLKAADFPWGKIEGNQVVADRGIFASDLVKALSSYRCHTS